MGLFVKKLYKILDPSFCVAVVIIAVFTFVLIMSYLKLNYGRGTYEKYTSYHNISVEIKGGEMIGKLNKYISIKNKNNICYVKNCGFPREGVYQLSSVHFYEIDKEVYIFKSCVNGDEYCFHNITDDLIYSLKERKSEYLKYNIKIGMISLLSFLVIGLYLTRIHSKE